jgi:large subunit ribosomal protein L10
MTSHTLEWKKKEVQELKELLNAYPVIGIASLKGFPSNLFAEIRKLLSDKAIVKVSKTRIFLRALQESKLKDSGLKDYIKNSIAVVFTELNPFELYSLLKKNKGNAPAKTGMIAPLDLVVPAGDTGLPPGPALSDLKAAGLKVKMASGSIEVTEDTVVCKKGEIVSEKVASVLSKLNIKPIKVGLNLNVVYENGELFKEDVLNIDEDKVFNDFVSARQNSFNLALNISYFTSETIPLLLAKAVFNSMNLALNAGILNEKTVESFISKASLQATILKSKIKNVSLQETKPEETNKAKKEGETENKKEEKKQNELNTGSEKEGQ